MSNVVSPTVRRQERRVRHTFGLSEHHSALVALLHFGEAV